MSHRSPRAPFPPAVAHLILVRSSSCGNTRWHSRLRFLAIAYRYSVSACRTSSVSRSGRSRSILDPYSGHCHSDWRRRHVCVGWPGLGRSLSRRRSRRFRPITLVGRVAFGTALVAFLYPVPGVVPRMDFGGALSGVFIARLASGRVWLDRDHLRSSKALDEITPDLTMRWSERLAAT